MADFAQMSPEEVLAFVDSHRELFAGEFDHRFPANVARGLAGSLWITIRRREGFAILYKGVNSLLGNDGQNADLMFLHVLPEFEGRGIGAEIVEEAKSHVPAGRPCDVTCEGKRRKLFFERCGFGVAGHDIEADLYYMQWTKEGIRNE